MLLEEVLKGFLCDCQYRKQSYRIINGYKNNNKRLFDYLRNEFSIFKLEEVRRFNIQSYISYLIEQKKKEQM